MVPFLFYPDSLTSLSLDVPDIKNGMANRKCINMYCKNFLLDCDTRLQILGSVTELGLPNMPLLLLH